ncbi:MAG TPA: hypothetical protein VMA36_14875 [Candidatus Limnocylindria bacterium]|nr:hypothetical protein [Candidatus Limnocylindria bacterium]
MNVGERWVCRGADTAHPANASMSGSNQALSCREVNATITTSTGQVYVIGNPASSTAPDERITVAGPVLSGEMTVSGLNDRWVEMMENALGTEATSGGTVNVGDRWVCRPADATHPQNAALSGGGSRPLACRPVNVSMTMSTGQLIVIGHVRARPPQPTATGETDMIAPPPSSALTPKQLDDAWTNTVMRVFNIATSAAGGG